jgi:lysophospholipase
MVRWLADLISALGLGAIYVSGRGPLPAEQFPFAGNLYTSDSRRFERNRKILEQDPGLGVGGPTLGWLSAAFKAMDQLQDKEFPTHIKVPVLVVSAGHDRVIVNQALERLVSHLPAGKLVTIDGARHEILMEKDIYREQFWAAFDAFIPGAAGERHGFRTSSAAS